MDLFDRMNDRMAKKQQMPAPEEALSGRTTPIVEPSTHYVLHNSIVAPFPENTETLIVGCGCFWGVERRFWTMEGIHTTAAGYSGGFTPNPTYEEVCTGKTGHNEVVLVVFDPAKVALEDVLARFWEAHDPTQGMRQGNDIGTQYRSGLYVTPAQRAVAEASKVKYQEVLSAEGHGQISTEIVARTEFYYAEDYHQQYLAKNPGGYCGLGGIGLKYCS
ncbi:peptide-methionine (S)-S-oxide reductase MsrA [Teredinibacter turnerae]|uniref:peptide-methionine (S)-S-oxide reductase MsrA n=1 Tax=Teredinibacter turnerae TaxID=2426 RepID=UPI0003695F29|nr:peptide-methionine (S)-S-oxide reductase MsrA [Teredinibacter turnerae]